MKKLLISMAVTASFAGSSYAADLPVKAAPRAPEPVASASWTGCYVGGGGGYGMFDQRHTTLSATGLPILTGLADVDTGGKGWFGTVQVGCDFQVADRWVIGAFGDYDFDGIKGRFSPTGVIGASGIGGIVGEEKQRHSWAVGGRLGYAVIPRLLAYVSGGYTEARFDAVSFVNVVGSVPSTFTMDAQDYKGWFIGSGYEYGLDLIPGLFWKTEYRYSSYRAEDVVERFGNGTVASLEHSRKYEQTIRSELVYRFNFFGGSSVAARY